MVGASSFLARRPVWQVSYLSALAASVAVETWGLAARAAGVPMRAAGLGSRHAAPITVGMFAMGAIVVTFWFTFAVVLMARFAKNPKRTCLHAACWHRAVPGSAGNTDLLLRTQELVFRLFLTAAWGNNSWGEGRGDGADGIRRRSPRGAGHR